MTAKHYFRNLELQDLGLPAEPKVLELRNYIEERLSNLKQYTSVKYPDCIYYGKSKTEIILIYNFNEDHIEVFRVTFTRKLFYEFNLQFSDIQSITLKYVEETLKIKANQIKIIAPRHSIKSLLIKSNY